jgi:chromosome segregation ATPase
VNRAEVEQQIMDLDGRLNSVEQILPTLLTRTAFQSAIETLGTELRRHFDVVAESLRGDVRVLAEGHIYLVARLDGVDQRLDRIEQRLGHVEHRLDGVEHRLDGVEQRLDRVEQRLDHVEQRLDRMEQRLERVEQHLL